MTASGSLLLPGGVHPEEFEKVIVVRWHERKQSRADHRWVAGRHMLFSPILEDVLFVGLVGEDLTKRRFFSDWRQYQDCF